MKTTTLALVLAIAASSSACSKDKKATTTPTPTADVPPAKADAPPPAPVTGDQQVSPGIHVSGDIAAACGLKVTQMEANPKFEYDADDLTADDRAVLDQIATCLISGPLKGKAVALIGRADPRGTEEYNLGLGSRRASSVSKYLARLGVGEPQLGVTTRGALDATGTDESGWKNDRRVDIQLAHPEG